MPSHSILHHLSSSCSRNNPPSLHKASTVSYLSTTHTVTSQTDGSVPGRLGEGEAGIYIKCTKCLTTLLFLG